MKQSPALFGQSHSSRDYSKAKYWGKNQFNSSFPASLVAYMSSKGIDPVYLCIDSSNHVVHTSISGAALFGIDPLSDDCYYNFEAGFPKYEPLYQGKREKMDLVIMDRIRQKVISSFEIKLTAIPDHTTQNHGEENFGAEIVVRPPTIWNLACSLCLLYNTPQKKERLRKILNQVPKINNWAEMGEVLPHFESIKKAVLDVSKDNWKRQSPLMIQPIWKTDGHRGQLADDCLDIFVWSNLAVIQMCIKNQPSSSIDRFDRTIIWIFKMLLEYITYEQFDYERIVKQLTYNTANDKAFAIPGNRSIRFLKSPELLHPRVSKREIKNIILGGGQNLLRPERRFDAVIVNTPDLFDE